MLSLPTVGTPYIYMKRKRNSDKLAKKLSQRRVALEPPRPTQTELTLGFHELLQRGLLRQQESTLTVEEFVKANGYQKIDPTVMFISVAQDADSGLWDAVLLAPDNTTETNFRTLSRFRSGTMLPESAKDAAGKMIPTVAILVNGLYEWPYFDHDKHRLWKRRQKLIEAAEARRVRRRAKRGLLFNARG